MEPARLRQQFDSGSRNPRRLIDDGKPTGRSGLSQHPVMSAMGQKATYPTGSMMSAFTTEADIESGIQFTVESDRRSKRVVTPAGFEPAASRLGILLPSLNLLIFYPAMLRLCCVPGASQRSLMSAFNTITDFTVAKRDVRYVPEVDIHCYSWPARNCLGRVLINRQPNADLDVPPNVRYWK
jgi:hypothetical protein